MGGCMRKTKKNSTPLKLNERSIESLPIECLLMIFRCLRFDDLFNVAKTCRLFETVAKKIFRQNISFTIGPKMVEKGNKYVDRLFYYTGEYVQHLDINCLSGKLNWNKIVNSCTNLKTLCIANWRGKTLRNVYVSFQINRVEQLILYQCAPDITMHVLERVHKLNYLSVSNCSIDPSCDTFTSFLKNNPNIKIFHFCDEDKKFLFDFQIVNLLSSVEEFTLSEGKFVNVAELLQLNRLSTLVLNCNGTNLNGILNQLAGKRILKELNFNSVKVDDLFFDKLRSFETLEVLVLSPSINSTIISPIWPANLKRLQLYQDQGTCGVSHFYFTLYSKAVISTIQHLHCIESLDFRGCEIVECDKVDFKDLEKLGQRIVNVMDHEVRKKRLYVFIPGHLGKGYFRVILTTVKTVYTCSRYINSDSYFSCTQSIN